MRFLKLIFGGSAATPSKDLERDARRSYGIREKNTVFDAWTSGDLGRMLKARGVPTNLIDRHFLLMGIVSQTYRKRADPKMRKLCKETAEQHIQEFSSIAPALKEDLDGTLPRVLTFQHYATVLAEDKMFAEAICVCEIAISFDLHDGTKSGFQGRISRIKKKMQQL